MSRADAKRSKQQRRALEDLTRGMRRRNLALVLEGFVGVLDEAPSAEVDEARRWLASELRGALRAGDRRALEPWLTAGGRLPDLLARLELDDEARWALFWAAAGAQHWKAAELMLRELEPLLRERAADLALAMSAIVTSRGRLELEHIPERMRTPPAAARLGVEIPAARQRRTRAAVPPATAAEAEQALVDCYATEPWDTFSTLAQRWLRAKPDEAVASTLGVTVAELACLELLRDVESAKTGCRWAVVDLIVTALSTLAPGSSEERERGERALLLGLRVVLGALTEPQAQRPPAGLVASAVRAGLAAPSLRDSVASAVTEIASREGAELSPQLLCELHELSPSPLLWASAVLALDTEQEQRFLHGRAPRRAAVEWLERTLAAHIADPGALQRSLSSLPAKRREELLSVLAASIAPALVADLCLALWPPPNDVQRRELADFAYEALDANTNTSFCVECGEPHTRDFDGSFSELSAGGKALYERVGPLLAASDERFLSLALERTQQPSEQSDLLVAFAHDGAPIDQHVTAIERARALDLPQEPLRERLRARFAGRTTPLARGLAMAVERFGARSSTARELAEALLDAGGVAPPSERSELVLTQLRLARRITGRKRQPQSPQQGSPFEESTS